MIVGNHKIHYLHQTTTTSSNLIFCLLRDIFLDIPLYKIPFDDGVKALTRERKAAEQDFCANILGAKQNVCWVGTDRGAASLEAT